jgi:hypothetical protein
MVRGAALAALQALPTRGIGGHPRDAPRSLARWIVAAWSDLGGAPCSPTFSARSGNASPIVHFGVAIFASVRMPRSESAVAKLLRQAR